MNENLVNSSFQYCIKSARKHYENFPVASLLIPKDKRKYIAAIYCFARASDDFADEPNIEGGKEKRLSLIDEWEQKLEDCFKGKAYDPIFIALNKTIEDCKIPIEPLQNLLKAFRQDVIKNRYDNFDEVLSYCENSANPVGRLVLMIFGSHDEKLFGYSDKICTALQLTNFWQDVAIDLEKDRIYLPEDEMKRFNYNEKELIEKTYNKNFIELMKLQVERTRKIFEDGKGLLDELKQNDLLKKLYRQLKLTWLGGMEILNKIEQVNYDVFNKRPSLSKTDFIKLFFK